MQFKTISPFVFSTALLLSLTVCDRQEEQLPKTATPPIAQPSSSPVAPPTVQTTPTPAVVVNPSPSPVSAPEILSRDGWQAKAPLAGMKPHSPSRITVHHTAEPQKKDASIERKLQSLQNFSQRTEKLSDGRRKPAWPDVPYHFYVDVNGRIAEGRDIGYAGDTNTDYDPTGHILIVLEGNFEKEQPSAAQLQKLEQLLLWLSRQWRIPASEIKGHRDHAATACPGANLQKHLPRLREIVGKQG